MQLDNWQQEIMEHEGNILLCTGRQVGKTTIFALKSAKYLLQHKNARIIIVSLTEDQAKLMIVMTLDYLEKNYPKLISDGIDKPTQNRIKLKNGSIALARPVGNTGNAVRGFTGDVLIIDEASRMPELAFSASKPTLLTTNGQIWICSTPFGKQGYFWQSFQNKSNRFKVWHISSEQALQERKINKGWNKEKKEQSLLYLKQEKADMTELQYGQEYLGLFLEDLRRFFDDKLINECCIIKRQQPLPKDNNYMGVDIARMGNDESAFQILNGDDNQKIRQIENLTTTKQLTTQTESKIIELSKQFNLIKIGVDAGSGSLGVGIYDHLLEYPETKKKVISMNNRTISLDRMGKQTQRIFKEDLYDNLKAMMEHGEILFLDDDNLRASFRSIQFEFIKDEGQKIQKVKIFGNYSHIVEGLIRASWLVKKERTKKMFIKYI